MIGQIPTFEEIMQRCLDRVSNTLDKRQGSIIYDAIAPVAVELAQMYIELEGMLDLVFIDTTVGEYLDRKAKELGIERKEATFAIRKGVFNIAVPIGSRFSIDNTSFIVLNVINGTNYRLQCEQAGTKGNEPYGDLTPISYIQGLKNATIEDILIPGEDVETDDELRKRYVDYVSQPAFGGNISDYQIKTKSIPGVGEVKVYPVWNGGGTVKLVITDSTYGIPSEELVNDVQEIVDPEPHQLGIGTAPIGHYVTVEGAIKNEVSIETTIVLQPGFVFREVEKNIKEVIENYFYSLRADWENQTETIIRIAQIETRVIGVPGVEDVNSTLINGSTGNLTIESNELPFVLEVVVNETD